MVKKDKEKGWKWVPKYINIWQCVNDSCTDGGAWNPWDYSKPEQQCYACKRVYATSYIGAEYTSSKGLELRYEKKGAAPKSKWRPSRPEEDMVM